MYGFYITVSFKKQSLAKRHRLLCGASQFNKTCLHHWQGLTYWVFLTARHSRYVMGYVITGPDFEIWSWWVVTGLMQVLASNLRVGCKFNDVLLLLTHTITQDMTQQVTNCSFRDPSIKHLKISTTVSKSNIWEKSAFKNQHATVFWG